MLHDASSCNQAEHHCLPQSSSALNWPIELDIWTIESQPQISSCQKRLIQTGGSKTLVFFPRLTLCSFLAVWWEKWLLISPAVPSGRCQELQWTAFLSPNSLKSFFWRYRLVLWLSRWHWSASGTLMSTHQSHFVESCGKILPYEACWDHFPVWLPLRTISGDVKWICSSCLISP